MEKKVLEENDFIEMGSNITVNLLSNNPGSNGTLWRRESSWELCWTVDVFRGGPAK
jgi:hypothetical protein